MDSSRGGPLTTFIMMLPLIVVPAIAMLKPADGSGGIISDLLNAATGAPARPESAEDGAAETQAGGQLDSFEALFADDAPEFRTSDGHASSGPPPFAGEGAGSPDGVTPHQNAPDFSAEDLLAEFDAAGFDSADTTASADAAAGMPPSLHTAPAQLDAKTQGLLATLQKMGVNRTLWFSPDGRRAGFVAFIDAGQGILRYRFESVAGTPVAAVSDVILQIEEWQRTTAQ